MEQEDEGEGGAEVVADRRHGAVAGGEAEVAGGPDAQRLEGRDLAEEVAEAGAVGVEGLELLEVDHPTDLGRDQNQERDRRQQQRPPGRLAPAERGFGEQPEDEGAAEPDQAREAVGVDGADRDQRRRDETQRQPRPAAVRLAQRQHEAEQRTAPRIVSLKAPWAK